MFNWHIKFNLSQTEMMTTLYRVLLNTGELHFHPWTGNNIHVLGWAVQVMYLNLIYLHFISIYVIYTYIVNRHILFLMGSCSTVKSIEEQP